MSAQIAESFIESPRCSLRAFGTWNLVNNQFFFVVGLLFSMLLVVVVVAVAVENTSDSRSFAADCSDRGEYDKKLYIPAVRSTHTVGAQHQRNMQMRYGCAELLLLPLLCVCVLLIEIEN